MDLQPSDIVFLAIVILIAIHITGGGGPGGLKDPRSLRIPVPLKDASNSN